jgi:hypothetical protein
MFNLQVDGEDWLTIRFDGRHESVSHMMFLVAIRVRRYSALALTGSIVIFTAAGIWIARAAERRRPIRSPSKT